MTTKKTFYFLFFCLFFINPIWTRANEPLVKNKTTSVFEVGTSMIDITPEVGYRQYRGKSTGIASPLYAKALVFKQGEVKGALLVCDLISISRSLSSFVRSEVAKQTDIPFQNISIAGTHIHTGPRFNEEEYIKRRIAGKLTEKDENDYVAQLVDNMILAIVEANKKVVPMDVSGGVGEAHGLAFNRRYFLKNGKVRFNPGFLNPDVVRPAGPVDPEVHFLLFSPKGKTEVHASLAVFPLHCDTKDGTKFHGDFPFHLQEELKKILGKQIISIFGQGTSGNINHYDISTPRESNVKGAKTEKIGIELAKAINKAKSSAKRLNPNLQVVSRMIYLPIHNYTESELEWALDKNSKSIYPSERKWITERRKNRIIRLRNLRRQEAIPPYMSGENWHLPIEIHVFKLDDQNAIVTLPGELFVELGMAIKEQSPYRNTLIIELANSRAAYIPTLNAYKEGDYEGVNNYLLPGSGEKIVEEVVKILNEIHK